MKKSVLKNLVVGMSIASTMSAGASEMAYTHADASALSANNFSDVNFKKAPEFDLITSRAEINVGETLMVHDRYHTVYQKDGKGGFTRIGMVARLDQLKVLGNEESYGSNFIRVDVKKSVSSRMTKLDDVYVRYKGLSKYQDNMNFNAEVYVIQNVATEKLRVYHRQCMDNSCPPRLLLETDFVAGLKKNDPKFTKRTRLGSYRIFEWHKFYQDKNGGHYPSWYDPEFPEQPGPEESWSKWFKKDVMPWKSYSYKDGKKKYSYDGMMRGAFGWYTALVEPNYATDQWMHGTIGWAESSEKNIKVAKGQNLAGWLGNLFSSLRSSGCSRVSNPTIAFLRHILPAGTPIIKIYALEKYQDQESVAKNYNKDQEFSWDYALTTEGVRGVGKNAINADKKSVDDREVSAEKILEEGTFKFENYPTLVQGKKGKCKETHKDKYAATSKEIVKDIKRLSKKRCNLYKIDADKFNGVFYVDTGLVSDYKHPRAKGILRGGFNSQDLPNYMKIRNYKK